jgi:hypothetical protein
MREVTSHLSKLWKLNVWWKVRWHTSRVRNSLMHREAVTHMRRGVIGRNRVIGSLSGHGITHYSIAILLLLWRREGIVREVR